MLDRIYITDRNRVQDTVEDFEAMGLRCEIEEHQDFTEIRVYIGG